MATKDEITSLLPHSSLDEATNKTGRNAGYRWSRWQSFASVCLYVSVAGTTYAYGVYSDLLKENLGFSQHGLDIVASVGNTGLYLSLLAGFALERYGLRFVVTGGGALILIGFLYIWAAVEGYVPANITTICVVFFLSQFGVCCHVSSSVTYAVRLFPPESRGISVGLVKGYFGLSSAVLGDFAGGYFANSPASFLVFISLFVPLVGSVACQFADLLPANSVEFQPNEYRSMMPFVLHWTLLFCVLMAIGILQFLFTLSDSASELCTTFLMISIFASVILPGLYGPRYLDSVEPSATKDVNTEQENNLDDRDEDDIEDESFPTNMHPGDKTKACFYGESVPFMQVIFLWRYWAMYLIFLTMTGVGLMVIYNINAIASSVGKSPSTFFVTLVSLANGLGRVLAGFISDISVKYISKLELLSIVILFMSITQALHSIGSGLLLYPCLLAVGFLFGCTVSLMAINIADIFGGQFIATNFGAIDSAAILGTVIFAAGVVNIFYKESDGDDDYGTNSCYESNCFRIPFVINSSFCLLAFIICLFVNWRTPSTGRTSSH